jgi:CorA-like Mg2+ transporter protein
MNAPCSHHIFLYPFTFECADDLGVFDKLLIEKGSWKSYEFDINKNKPHSYNEWVYFHRASKEVLFGSGEKDILRQYQYKLGDQPIYKIAIEEGKKNKKTKQWEVQSTISYKLEVADITLNFYKTGVGVLAFHLNNRRYRLAKDILKINDFGRRCYPQFLSLPDNKGKTALSDVKNVFLASKITVLGIEEDFTNFFKDIPQEGDRPKYYIPHFIQKLFNSYFNIQFIPIIDDRMFVICWFGKNRLAKALATKHNISNEQTIPYLTTEQYRNFWYKYTFIDGNSAGIANVPMQKRLIEESTYERWSDYGTLYGITRYSFVMLTDRGGLAKDVLFPHIQNMYFQMVQLCLVQRASILKLQTDIAQEATKGNLAAIEKIYKNDLTFIHKIFFRELTAQEQGIELYKKLHERMEIPAQMKELDAEIQQLHAYTNLLDDQRTSNALDTLAVMGSIFLVPSFLISYYGANVLPELDDKTIIVPLMVVCAVSAIFSYGIFWTRMNCKSNKIFFWLLVLLLIYLLGYATIIMPRQYEDDKELIKIDTNLYYKLIPEDNSF